MLPLAQVQSPQMPALPLGPSLERVRGPIEIPIYSNWQLALFVVLAVISLALLLWAIRAVMRSILGNSTTLDPAKAAKAELEAAALGTKDQRFAIGSSQALRRYLSQELNISSSSLTSEEFLIRVQKHPRLSQEFKTSLERFQNDCDAVKFAQCRLNSSARHGLTQQALSLVEQAESMQQEAAE